MSDENEEPAHEVEARGRATRSKPACRLNSTARGDRSRFPVRVNVRVRPPAWSLPRQRRGSRS